MILISKDYEVLLTYSPISEVTGHIYEVFEYYLVLRKYFRTAMFFHAPTISKERILNSLRDKYSVPWESYAQDFYHSDRVERIIGAESCVTILCDGNIKSLWDSCIVLATPVLLGFRCGNYDFNSVCVETSLYNNFTFLQDYRVYARNSEPQGCPFLTIDYRKKFNFSAFRRPEDCVCSTDTALLYLTRNCRYMSPSGVREVMEAFPHDRYLILTPTPDEYDVLKSSRVRVVQPPVYPFFKSFSTYIYTPIPRRFDCSPRLITECAYYGKPVQYFLDEDYQDVGLQVRRRDIESKDGLRSLTLKDDDRIVDIVSAYRGSISPALRKESQDEVH